MAHCETKPLSVYIFVWKKDNNKNLKNTGVYTNADTNQEMHLHLEMGNAGKRKPVRAH